MNPSELMVNLATFLAGDQELQQWCQANLASALKIQLGVDENNPPGRDDYPIVGITDVVEKRGENQQYQVFTVELSCGLVNEEIAAPSGNLVIYSGLPQVADLKHQIEAACFRFRPGGCSVAGDSVPMSFYPLFVGYTTLEYQLPRSKRQAMR